jgi:signal transduction histidine kinase
MEAPATDTLLRFVARIMGGSSPEFRRFQELRRMRGVLRFAGVVLVTIVVPATTLAFFALQSIQNEEASVDTEVRWRSLELASQIHSDAEVIFDSFEQAFDQRLVLGRPLVAAPDELAPYVLAAYQLDIDPDEQSPDLNRHLVGPFATPERWEPPSKAYQRHWEAARQLRLQQRHDESAKRFRAAAAVSNQPGHAGQAHLAAASALHLAGREDQASDAYIDVISEYPEARDQFGFRLADLAKLKQAEIGFIRSPDAGIEALKIVVEEMLFGRQWTLNQPGEAAIARRGLNHLKRLNVDPEWLGQRQQRLEQRNKQLYWSAALINELQEFLPTAARARVGSFVYRSRGPDAPLFAASRSASGVFVFAFDQRAIISALKDETERMNERDPDMRVSLARPAIVDVTRVTVTHQSLSPWLEHWETRVRPADPADIALRKQSRRQVRFAVVGLTVALIGVGIVLMVRLVTQELQSARVKADFAANVSHELRSPITHIRLKAEALQFDLVYDDEDRMAHYDAIVREAERLSRLVDNVLDYAAIERGTKQYTFRPEDITSLLHAAIEMFRTTAESSGMEVEVDVPDLPVVWLDREAMSQVLTNLLSNAVKYGSTGQWLGIHARYDHADVHIEISDRGMGIAAADLPNVFEHFYRSEDPGVRRKKGTGIGLTIVRYIVEAHGGTISVESAPQMSTTFTVTLPLEPKDGA